MLDTTDQASREREAGRKKCGRQCSFFFSLRNHKTTTQFFIPSLSSFPPLLNMPTAPHDAAPPGPGEAIVRALGVSANQVEVRESSKCAHTDDGGGALSNHWVADTNPFSPHTIPPHPDPTPKRHLRLRPAARPLPQAPVDQAGRVPGSHHTRTARGRRRRPRRRSRVRAVHAGRGGDEDAGGRVACRVQGRGGGGGGRGRR